MQVDSKPSSLARSKSARRLLSAEFAICMFGSARETITGRGATGKTVVMDLAAKSRLMRSLSGQEDVTRQNFRPSRLAVCGSARDARSNSAVRLGQSLRTARLDLISGCALTEFSATARTVLAPVNLQGLWGITQKSAWLMLHRIRTTLHDDSTTKFSGECEADETFIGGKARNMHFAKKARRITGTGTKNKTAVMGILERGGKVRTTVVPNRRKSAFAGWGQEACRG